MGWKYIHFVLKSWNKIEGLIFKVLEMVVNEKNYFFGSKTENIATIDILIILKNFQLISVSKICRNMGSKVSAP